ncbi:MAG: SNF2-related protein, partial [Actinomycetota bacterium]|nr:SNF2-related protein [Actinomycetota bacterium]
MKFKTGSKVRTKDGRVGVVADSDGDYTLVIFPDSEETIHIDDLELLQPGPIDQLRENKFDGRHAEFVLCIQSLFLKHAAKFDPQYGLSNARIEPLPHQVFTAHAALSKQQPRLILADEVGLGKTIEAGLILKELITREAVDRILVICPAS